MRQNSVRVFKVCFLFFAIFVLVATLATVQVAAQDASGSWTSRVYGFGMVIETHPGACNYEVELTLSQVGVNADGSVNYTGTLKQTCITVDERAGDEGWLSEKVGETQTNIVNGRQLGTSFTLVVFDPEGTFSYPLMISGGTMTGSGEYSDPSTQISYDYIFDLVGGSSNGETPDIDDDGLPDNWEMEHFGNLAQSGSDDPDGDGLTNLQEYEFGTDPNDNQADSDGDGLPDSWEIEHFGNLTQSGSGDFDGDGLTNLQEYEFGTDPEDYQSDGDRDGLPDLWEIEYFGDLSKRGSRDTDLDGHSNLQEYEAGSDPNDPLDEPEDTDADGMSDTWEMENFNSLGPDADNDFDGDDFTNIQEYKSGTDPTDITDHPYTSSEPKDNTNLIAGLATISMVAIFAIVIYANARRYKKKHGSPREWSPPPQQYQQPPQEQPPPAQEQPPTQEPPQYQENPPPPPSGA